MVSRGSESYDEIDIGRQIENLPLASRVVFACACAERLFPAYGWFCQVTGVEGLDVVRSALDLGWSMTGPYPPPLVELDSLSQQVEALAVSVYVDDLKSALAQSAVASVAFVLRALRDRDNQAPVWAARQLYEAADAIVQESAPIQKYVSDIERQPPIMLVVHGINLALANLAAGSVGALRSQARQDGEALLGFANGPIGDTQNHNPML